MLVPLFIPYVNRRDLLERAVRIAATPGVEINVLDNSNGSSFAFDGVDMTVRRPTVPLTFTQTQNWMFNIAEADSDYERRFYLWMHCDAIPSPGAVERLVDRAYEECAKGTKWGVIYTHYDILCAYSVEAVAEVGGYDTDFFDYCSDQDFYRRLDLAGYARIESGIEVGHEGSSTIKSDPRQNRRVGLQVPYRAALYRAMWGGEPGHETFTEKWGEPR